ncbi:MAG: AtpZ/AtpI family protein [Hyphomicrobiales bacterium]|nr:AtpZ/AtpI family protein [Hyphomicrobiales bacterium]
MGEERKPQDEAADLKARLDALAGRIAKAEQPTRQEADPESGNATSKAMSLGMRVLGEFVAAVAVSAVIGWQIDQWAGTAPAALLIFLAMGTAAGFYGVYRTASQPSGGGVYNKPRNSADAENKRRDSVGKNED